MQSVEKLNCNVSPFYLTIGVKMSDEKWRKFGQFLKSEREKAEVPQTIVAKKADIHVVQLSRIENGHSGARRETIQDIVKAINESCVNGHKVNLGEILNKAGFTSAADPVIPEELAIMDYDGFDKGDLKDIAEYIAFKRAQKLKELEAEK